MGGFLDGIDGDRLYRRDRHLIDIINYYRQMDKMDGMGNMRQDKTQKKRDTCW